MAVKKVPKDKDRVALSQCVGKLMAYIRVGNREAAKEWAQKLVDHLKRMGLVD